MTVMTQNTDLSALERALLDEIAAADDLGTIERVLDQELIDRGLLHEFPGSAGILPASLRS